MKTKAEVTAVLLQGASGQPAGRYVNVLAEDVVLALTPDPTPASPASENHDNQPHDPVDA